MGDNPFTCLSISGRHKWSRWKYNKRKCRWPLCGVIQYKKDGGYQEIRKITQILQQKAWGSAEQSKKDKRK